MNSIVPAIQESVLTKLKGVEIEEQEILFADALSFTNVLGTYKKASDFVKNNVQDRRKQKPTLAFISENINSSEPTSSSNVARSWTPKKKQ